MTIPQQEALVDIVRRLRPAELHHGDCIGADDQFEGLAANVMPTATTHSHPPTESAYRARCQSNVIHEPLEYLERNRAIVDATDALVAAPKGPEELRSGTWSTVRYARKQAKPIAIVFPDGTVRVEANGPRNQLFLAGPHIEKTTKPPE